MSVDRDELFRLFGALGDGAISEADHQRLQELLRDDENARKQWFLYSDIEAGLANKPDLAVPLNVPLKEPLRFSRKITWWGIGTAAAAAILASFFLFGRSSPQESIARLSASNNAQWGDPNVELTLRGGGLPPGLIQLDAGAAEFLFAGGATAVIEGPAVFSPVAANRLILKSGRVIGRCGPHAEKLVIVTPNAVIKDLGTEFGVSVGNDLQTRVAVIKGSVEVEAGKQPQRLVAGQSGVVNSRGQYEESAFGNDFKHLSAILPDTDLQVKNVKNLLRDEAIRNLSREWSYNEGYVDVNEAGNARIRANGNTLWPLIWQAVPTGDIVGKTVIASVSAMHPAGDPLRERQNAIIKIVFLDAKGRHFASAERCFLPARAPRGEWIKGQIAAVAPPGTAEIRFQALLNACGLKTGSLCYTDASLVIVPE